MLGVVCVSLGAWAQADPEPSDPGQPASATSDEPDRSPILAQGASSSSGGAWLLSKHPVSGFDTLVFLPPVDRRVRPGQAHVARRVDPGLSGLAASDDSAVLIVGERVFRITAAARGVAGAWGFLPERGFSPLPNLPDATDVRGVAIAGRVVAVLIDEGRAVLLGDGQAWQRHPGPGVAKGARVGVASIDGRLSVIERVAGALRVWSALVTDPAGEPAWARVDFPVDGATGERSAVHDRDLSPGSVFGYGGEVFGVCRVEGGFEVVRLSSEGPVSVARVSDIPPNASWAVRPESGRVTFLWSDAVAGDQTRPALPNDEPLGWRVVEVSLLTGLELSRSEGGPALPVTGEDFRRLALLLFVFTVVVLLGALGPRAEDQVIVLPAGYALASPWRRVVAWLIDAVPGAIVWIVLGAEAGLTAGLSVSIACAAVGESLSGRSIGKALTGMRVVRVGGGVGLDAAGRPRRPSLFASLARNGVCWLLPPIAAFGAFGRERRHVGDVSTRTAVVVVMPGDTRLSDEG